MKSPISEPRIVAIMSGQEAGPIASAARMLMAGAEPCYLAVVRLRNWMFDIGVRRSYRAMRPVISVGNLTTGGTGKTPVVAWISRKLLARGYRPAVLLRGYKSAAGISDEATLLSRMVAPAPVMPNPDRVTGAAEALTADPSLDCFILDDGFQHRRLSRSLDIVLIDATEPFGFDHLLPRGLLREPIDGLQRCDCVIITRCESAGEAALQSIREHVRAVNAELPILQCTMELSHYLDQDGLAHPISEAKRYFAICGIGNPRNFLAQLKRQSAPIVGELIFPDHHNYSEADFADVVRQARAASAKQIITTEKDWTKLEKLRRVGQRDFAIWRAIPRVEFSDGDAERLMKLIASALET